VGRKSAHPTQREVNTKMHCWIYRSTKQDEMYLYLIKKDQFDLFPVELLQRFGPPELVMDLDLATRAKLARANIDLVKKALAEKGFYLQVPPTITAHLHQGDGL
jgi:uncharacterized protein YcgL (UPF0745 family)